MGRKSIPSIHSQRLFSFGDATVRSLGLIEVAFQTPVPWRLISIILVIVSVEIPALLGFKVLGSECLYPDNLTNCLLHRRVASKERIPLKYINFLSVLLARFDDH